jgi:hypothetical protein
MHRFEEYVEADIGEVGGVERVSVVRLPDALSRPRTEESTTLAR